jgi:transketolase
MHLQLDTSSIAIRQNILKILTHARRGHVGSAFSNVEILRVLYENVLRVKPKNPKWKYRDRFILSKGHGCLSLYVILSHMGFFTKKELEKFCRHDSILGGHPQYGKVPGIEASTGSLGHGLPIAVGIATNAKIDNQKYHVYILLSDGECNEGSTWEAALHAAKHKLDNLTILVDYNKLQSYSTTTEVLDLEPFAAKWKAFGFHTQEVSGHDTKAILKAIKVASGIKNKPQVIICHTTKGKGIAFIENDPSWHHKSKISDEEMEKLVHGLHK